MADQVNLGSISSEFYMDGNPLREIRFLKHLRYEINNFLYLTNQLSKDESNHSFEIAIFEAFKESSLMHLRNIFDFLIDKQIRDNAIASDFIDTGFWDVNTVKSLNPSYDSDLKKIHRALAHMSYERDDQTFNNEKFIAFNRLFRTTIKALVLFFKAKSQIFDNHFSQRRTEFLEWLNDTDKLCDPYYGRRM